MSTNIAYHPVEFLLDIMQTGHWLWGLTLLPPHRCFHFSQPDWATCSTGKRDKANFQRSRQVEGGSYSYGVNWEGGRLTVIILPQSWSILQQCRDTKASCPWLQLFPLYSPPAQMLRFQKTLFISQICPQSDGDIKIITIQLWQY